MKTQNKIKILSLFLNSKHKKRAINKLTLEYYGDLSKKENMRKKLIELRNEGFLYNELGYDGAQKWGLSVIGKNFLIKNWGLPPEGK